MALISMARLNSCILVGNDAPMQLLKRMNRLPGNCRAGLLAYGYGLNETALRLAMVNGCVAPTAASALRLEGRA